MLFCVFPTSQQRSVGNRRYAAINRGSFVTFVFNTVRSALEFDPDRFLDERLQKYLIPNPSIFLPFNAGPRLCLGKQFAYNETSFMLIRFLQSFEAVALCPEAQPEGSCPPKEWSSSENVAMGKRKAIEKFFPKTHMTMYAHVSSSLSNSSNRSRFLIATLSLKGGLWLTLGEASDTEP
jgi:hypothetical protein